MTIYTYESLNKAVENGEGGTCICVDGARIIIPTDCPKAVGFTNPDDLDVALLDRWRKGERGPSLENQQLMPGDCLVLYDNGRNINKILDENPDWHKTPEGIKNMIEKLYACAEAGGKNTEPAIWNSDLKWAESVKLATSTGQRVTPEVWKEQAGRAMSVVKSPVVQRFLHVQPGDKLYHPPEEIERETDEDRVTYQTAASMSGIVVQQPDGTWNMVQLNAKGYVVVDEGNVKSSRQTSKTPSVDWLKKKQEALEKKLHGKVGETADRKTGKIREEHKETARKQINITRSIMFRKRQSEEM